MPLTQNEEKREIRHVLYVGGISSTVVAGRARAVGQPTS